jgi:hypothetical protein
MLLMVSMAVATSGLLLVFGSGLISLFLNPNEAGAGEILAERGLRLVPLYTMEYIKSLFL